MKPLYLLMTFLIVICFLSLTGCTNGPTGIQRKESRITDRIENKAPIIKECKADYFDKFNSPIVYFSAYAIDYDGNIISYLWKIGDGSTSTDAQFTHTFEKNGVYDVNLSVMDNDGAITYYSLSLEIYGAHI